MAAGWDLNTTSGPRAGGTEKQFLIHIPSSAQRDLTRRSGRQGGLVGKMKNTIYQKRPAAERDAVVP